MWDLIDKSDMSTLHLAKDGERRLLGREEGDAERAALEREIIHQFKDPGQNRRRSEADPRRLEREDSTEDELEEIGCH